ncbi:MAG: hypothetical protein LBM19_00135 [Holosporales bacterium]|jgi:hypothetical protein|nr:hypothetical protein [Holosporales bacterium]
MKKIIFAILSLSLNALCSDLTSVTNNYVVEMEQSQAGNNPADKQAHRAKAKEYAEMLLGKSKNTNFKSYEKIKALCDVLDKKAAEMQNSISTADEKAALKTKRDISNYIETAKFLRVSSKLLDAIYENPTIVDLILEKTPQSIPLIGREIVAMLRVLEIIVANPDDINSAIEKAREFATSSEDGTHLLSQLISVALEYPDNVDFIKLLSETDFSNKNLHKYLKIR